MGLLKQQYKQITQLSITCKPWWCNSRICQFRKR